MVSTRAERASSMLQAYVAANSSEQLEAQSLDEWLIDAITDLMHFSAQKELNVEAAIARARQHFKAEQFGAL